MQFVQKRPVLMQKMYFSFGPALWWSAAARAMAIDCCSCLRMARSCRPCRRWAARVTGCPLAIIAKATLRKRKETLEPKWLVVEVLTLVFNPYVCSCEPTIAPNSGVRLLASPPPWHSTSGRGCEKMPYFYGEEWTCHPKNSLRHFRFQRANCVTNMNM